MRIAQPLFSDYPLRYIFEMRRDRTDRLLLEALERPSLTTKAKRLEFAIGAAEIYPLELLFDRMTVTVVPDVCYTTYITYVGDSELWQFAPGEDLPNDELLDGNIVASTLILTELEHDPEACRLWTEQRLDLIQSFMAEQLSQILTFNAALPAYADDKYRELIAKRTMSTNLKL